MGRCRYRHDAALLPVDERDDQRVGHASGHRRGRRAGGGHQRGVDLADRAVDTRRLLLRRVRVSGVAGVRQVEQLLDIRVGHCVAVAGSFESRDDAVLGER